MMVLSEEGIDRPHGWLFRDVCSTWIGHERFGPVMRNVSMPMGIADPDADVASIIYKENVQLSIMSRLMWDADRRGELIFFVGHSKSFTFLLSKFCRGLASGCSALRGERGVRGVPGDFCV